MTEGWAGWPEAHELPVSEHLRTVAEVLASPPTPEERRQAKREQAEAAERREELRDVADSVAAAAFRAQVNGRAPRGVADVLAGAAAGDALDREEHDRRRAAVRILRQHGLEDVLGVPSGTVWDANMGELAPEPDPAERARLNLAYEIGRSEREVAARNRAVEQYRQHLDERTRARGWDRRVSSRSMVQPADDAERRRYERACAEIGERPVSYR
jgi:hypothetical protein